MYNIICFSARHSITVNMMLTNIKYLDRYKKLKVLNTYSEYKILFQ